VSDARAASWVVKSGLHYYVGKSADGGPVWSARLCDAVRFTERKHAALRATLEQARVVRIVPKGGAQRSQADDVAAAYEAGVADECEKIAVWLETTHVNAWLAELLRARKHR
jgi:hypothetical protein